MKKLCIIFVLLMGCINSNWATKITYKKEDSLKVVQLLTAARHQHVSNNNYTLYFARKLKGIPYVAHTLEINKTEKLVVNLRQLDCTTLVENAVALQLCMQQKIYTFAAFCKNLQRIRYRQGCAPYYPARLHYFTDWIEDNSAKGICHELQSPNPPFTAVQKVNVYFMSKHPDKYAMLKANPSYVPIIAKDEQRINRKSYRYIPKSSISNSNLLRQTIHDGDILALTTSLKGLDIQHIGFAVWHKDGLHLLNASSLRHKVVEEPQLLSTYLRKQKSMTGVRVIRLK